jgi:hypothetical protein
VHACQGRDASQVMFQLAQGMRPQDPSPAACSTVPEGFLALMHDCWAQDAAVRPTFEEIAKRLQEMVRGTHSLRWA